MQHREQNPDKDTDKRGGAQDEPREAAPRRLGATGDGGQLSGQRAPTSMAKRFRSPPADPLRDPSVTDSRKRRERPEVPGVSFFTSGALTLQPVRFRPLRAIRSKVVRA